MLGLEVFLINLCTDEIAGSMVCDNDDIGSGLSMRKRLLDQHLLPGRGQGAAVVAAHHACRHLEQPQQLLQARSVRAEVPQRLLGERRVAARRPHDGIGQGQVELAARQAPDSVCQPRVL